MTSEEILKTISRLAPTDFRAIEVIRLQRYFLFKYCKSWMSLKTIAEATGIKDHRTVIESVDEVTHFYKYHRVKKDIEKELNKRLQRI